jgi:hypothetical protein
VLQAIELVSAIAGFLFKVEHCFPPDKGFGDEHVLDLFWVPPPQNLLQELNLLQDDQPPPGGQMLVLHNFR